MAYVNYSPVENYFDGSGNKNLFTVNNALKQLEDAEVKETDVCSLLLLPSLINVTVETAEGGVQTEPIISGIKTMLMSRILTGCAS
jgi:hypothetical protein